MSTSPLPRILRALAFVALVPLAAPGTVLPSGWPEVPGDGLRAATLPVSEATAHLSIEPGRVSDLFLAWTQSNGELLRVQRLTDAGSAAYGASGTIVRSGAGLQIGPPATRRSADARGPLDLFPASDGGVLVAWTERGAVGRDLRVQRLDAGGNPLYAAGGIVALQNLPDAEEGSAVVADGADGVYAASLAGNGGSGTLRFQRVRADGVLAFPLPGLSLDSAANGKSSPALALLRSGQAAVAWYRDDGNGLRFQVAGEGGVQLAGNGVPIGISTAGIPSLRTVGSSLPGYVLVAHRLVTEVRAVLVDAFGAVIRDELAGTAALAFPPVITAANATINALPEGIELKGVRSDGTAVRFVRTVNGSWQKSEEVTPPSPNGPGASGARTGPGWAFDLGTTGSGPGAPRLLAWRPTEGDRNLDPVLGPWTAASPGPAGSLRVAFTTGWTFTAWVVPDGGSGGFVAAARAGGLGGLDILDVRGLEFRSLRVSRPPAPRPGVFAGAAPETVFPAASDPGTGKSVEPSSFRVRAGSENGLLADCTLDLWKGGRNGAFRAKVGDASRGVTGVVRAGSLGRNVRVKLKGLALDPGERSAWVRIDLDGEAVAATVPLTPNRNGKKAKYRLRP